MSWTTLCELPDLTPNMGKYVEIGGYQLAVFLHDGSVFVMDNYCPHAGGNLGGGMVVDGCAVCPWHMWSFRLDNGQLRDAPGVTVKTYKTRLFTHSGKQLVQADLPVY